MSESTPDGGRSASELIDARIAELGDWRGETLGRLRAIIKAADPDAVETWKWRGVPVWEHAGIICTGETYKAAVKLTFAKGAALQDPASLFNSSLGGERPPRHRHPRRRAHRRGGPRGAGQGRRGAEHLQDQALRPRPEPLGPTGHRS